MKVKSEYSIPNLEIITDDENIIIISKNGLECLSNAAINGGRVKSNSIVNHHVPLDFNHTNLEKVLEPIKSRYLLSDSTIGLLTAVEMKKAIFLDKKVDEINCIFIVTAGLTNTCAPDIENIKRSVNSVYKPGTINTIILLDCELTEHAIVNLFITLTEAKTLLFNMLNIRTKDGRLATGTSTDTIVISFTGKGRLIEWAGYATEFGQSIGYSFIKALKRALQKELES